MTSTLTRPMPDTNCPSWCHEDHRPDWDQWVTAGSDDTPIPAAGGGFLPTDNRTPIGEWLAQWRPYHRSRVLSVDLDRDEPVHVDLACGLDGPDLYLDGEGVMTAAQARELAAGLLDAADELERVAQ